MSKTLTTEQRDTIFNEVIMDTMIKHRNRILELNIEHERLSEEYMKVASEGGNTGRSKVVREALYKCRMVQHEIAELENSIVKLFMNYKQQ